MVFTIYVVLAIAVVGFAAFGAGAFAFWPPMSGKTELAPGRRERTRRRPAECVSLAALDPDAIERAAQRLHTPGKAAVKRTMDIAASLAVIILCAPLLALVALAISLESPGPVFYRQRRVGLMGREFDIWKFRSMRIDAEADGPRYAQKQDRRVTRVGAVIRKFRIDEMPQVINVLRGDMSFIGPRPERPEFVDVLAANIEHYDCRHLVKPGITGWAQVKCEYAASVADARRKLQYDLFYIREFSILRELAILALTVRVVLFGVGAR